MSKCTGWFDGWFGKSWADACQLHDDRYMTVMGKGMTRLECDLELMRNVAKVCKPMGYLMFVGVYCFGWHYWKYYEEDRNELVV